MSAITHTERHFTSSEIVRDIVLGMSDGLTVPFALAAGLTGAIATSDIIVTAGLAEIVAGSIAMGLGGYLSARSEIEHYDSEQAREHQEVRDKPAVEAEEVAEVFRSYGLSEEQIAPVVNALRKQPQAWVDFMMRFELGLEKPDPSRAVTSALAIGGAYVVGGLVPLIPYMMFEVAREALPVSAGVTLVALFSFGYVKGRFTGTRPFRSALQTMLIGSVAAAAAFLIASAIS